MKYWIIIIPVTITGTFTSMVTNITPFRDYLNDNFPGTGKYI